MRDPVTSRIAGFYKDSLTARVARIVATGLLSADSARHLTDGGGLAAAIADRMSENVIACHGLPLAIALNFRVNGRDVLVPMAVEEPSVVAAASNAARIVRMSGGFSGEASAPIMTAQIQLDGVGDPAGFAARMTEARATLLALGNDAIPGMLLRGGGCRDLETRDLGDGMVVVHVYVDVGDAMGANLVDSVAEALAEPIAELSGGGRVGLRILSNLPLRRMVRVTACASPEALGGDDLAQGIERASRFAERDPFRAVTHNKGIMNGIDAVAVALGQDWRSIEAGAHAYAALTGTYRPLCTWRVGARGLEGVLELPLAAATVGGSTRAHDGVRAAFELVQVGSARELAVIMAAAGLASNLAALRALAGEGIQRGHMKLHERKLAATPPIVAARGGIAMSTIDGSGEMFDTIAPRYDLVNRIISLGIDQGWRRKTVASLALQPHARVLDAATGTADLAMQIVRRHGDVRVVGIDPSRGMLAVGDQKLRRAGLSDRIELLVGDAQALDLPDATVDASCMAFGIRNVPDRAQALRELGRVTRPGGKIAILELSEPKRGLLAPLARFYIHHLVPWVGSLVSGRAYRHLEKSIARFPQPDEFADLMTRAGLHVDQVRPLTFGVACLYVATATGAGA